MTLLYREVKVINLAMIWNSFMLYTTIIISKNVYSYAQSVGNLYRNYIEISNKVSSETIRKTSFIFKDFNNIRLNFYPNTTPIQEKWLEWFIGFTEGDGSIITSINAKQQRLRFVITQKENKILIHIRDVIGFGVVRHSKKGDYYRYIVEDNKNIIILCTLFNGNLVIPHRINQLSKWVQYLNLARPPAELVLILLLHFLVNVTILHVKL